MIKYQYAFNSGKEVVDISTINDYNRFCSFYCVWCGGELIAKLGAKNKHHFAHKNQDECRGETYLHKLGKRIFIDHYKACMEQGISIELVYFQISLCEIHRSILGSPCYAGKNYIGFDLTRRFDIIKEECTDGDFVPDILLTNACGEKIYVEIAVTHKCDVAKLRSGTRIIEFVIDKESDMDSLRQQKYYLPAWARNWHVNSGAVIRFYNFLDTPPDYTQINSIDGCMYSFPSFFVYNSGRFKLCNYSFRDYDYVVKSSHNLIYHKMYLPCNVSGVITDGDIPTVDYEMAIKVWGVKRKVMVGGWGGECVDVNEYRG